MASEFRIEAPGAELSIRDHGGDGEVVVLLHGGPGVPGYLEPVADVVRRLGLRAVTFDQRGSGRSIATNASYGPLDHMSDVDAVRAHLGIEQIHVFGHSWGGLLGQLYLAQHPDRVSSLFLCSSAPGVGQEWRTCGKEIFEFNRRRAGWLGFAAMGVDSVGMLVPPIADASARRLIARVWRNYFPDPRIAPSATAASLAGIHAAPMRETGRAVGAADAGLLEGIGRTAIPVVIEFGGDDIYVTAADVLRRRFPNARHESLPHSGHLPWLQDPERFRAMLAEFYARSTR